MKKIINFTQLALTAAILSQAGIASANGPAGAAFEDFKSSPQYQAMMERREAFFKRVQERRDAKEQEIDRAEPTAINTEQQMPKDKDNVRPQRPNEFFPKKDATPDKQNNQVITRTISAGGNVGIQCNDGQFTVTYNTTSAATCTVAGKLDIDGVMTNEKRESTNGDSIVFPLPAGSTASFRGTLTCRTTDGSFGGGVSSQTKTGCLPE